MFTAARAGRFINVFDCTALGPKEPLYNFALEHNPIDIFVTVEKNMCHLGAVADNGSLYLWQKQFEATGSSQPILPTVVSSSDGQVMTACFVGSDTILCARGSQVKPLFDTFAFRTSEGELVSQLNVVTASENLLLDAEEMETSSARGKKSKQVHVVSLADKAPATMVKDLDDIGTDQATSETEETTLADRLAQLQEVIDADIPTAGDNEEDEVAGTMVEPQSGSLIKVLEQALQSKDNSMLEYCLRLTDVEMIETTVEGLNSTRVIPFLTRIVDKFERKPMRGHNLCIWIRAILKFHTAYLMTVPELVHKLSTLYQTLEARLAVFSQLYRVSGRLELMLNQIARQSESKSQSIEPEAIFTEP